MSRLDKMEKLLKIANDGLSYEEFIRAFDKITDQILRLEAELIEKVNKEKKDGDKRLKELVAELEQTILQAKTESDSTFSGIRKRTKEAIIKLFARTDVN